MAGRIEDYALLGDCETAALVSREGSIDWFCAPRFDSAACFCALLGTPEHGRWLLTPESTVRHVQRRYHPGTLVLVTDYLTADGEVTVTDFMPPRTESPDILRIVTGRRGQVAMRGELSIRHDYGSIVPWVRREDDGISSVAGPDRLRLRTTAPLRGQDYKTYSEFSVSAGQEVAFVLSWSPSHLPDPAGCDPGCALRDTLAFWAEWSGRCRFPSNGSAPDWDEAVRRSLITLKALTYRPTGGIVAAATTSLPEQLGGVRNWDYRYCWVRDATFTLMALLLGGYQEEAQSWREWLLRAIAGKPAQLQILYGLAGERRLAEWEVDWLPGYEGARPVRVGNAASTQVQLDVYGELLDAMHQARRAGLGADGPAWRMQRALVEYLEGVWDQPDEGIWEVRGGRRRFTHSQVMAWVALDRAIKGIEEYGLRGPLDRWKALRARIHAEVCERGFDAAEGAFVQSYGAKELDASLLMIPLVGFLPATDPRVVSTVAAVERRLLWDGLVRRYEGAGAVDGLPGQEGVFLACSFWLADNYVLLGRRGDATRLFERLLALRNDVGLLAEEYDPVARRQIGNFPQAFSHVALINTAYNLAQSAGPARQRAEDGAPPDPVGAADSGGAAGAAKTPGLL